MDQINDQAVMKEEVVVTEHHDGSSAPTPMRITTPTPAAIDQEELAAKLKIAQESKLEDAQETGINYWQAQRGDEFRGVFMGIRVTQLPNNDAELVDTRVACFQISERLGYISAAIALVGACENLAAMTPIYVKCIEATPKKAKRFEIKTW